MRNHKTNTRREKNLCPPHLLKSKPSSRSLKSVVEDEDEEEQRDDEEPRT